MASSGWPAPVEIININTNLRIFGAGGYLVSLNFTFSIIFKSSVTYESAFNNFPEFLGKLFVVEEVVYSKT